MRCLTNRQQILSQFMHPRSPPDKRCPVTMETVIREFLGDSSLPALQVAKFRIYPAASECVAQSGITDGSEE